MTTPHDLPLGTEVVYRHPENGDQATLIVVQHSRDCGGDPLYMVAQRPIEPPPGEFKLYSLCYLAYRLNAGWFVGNVGRASLTPTGRKMRTTPFLKTHIANNFGRFDPASSEMQWYLKESARSAPSAPAAEDAESILCPGCEHYYMLPSGICTKCGHVLPRVKGKQIGEAVLEKLRGGPVAPPAESSGEDDDELILWFEQFIKHYRQEMSNQFTGYRQGRIPNNAELIQRLYDRFCELRHRVESLAASRSAALAQPRPTDTEDGT